MAVLQGCAVGGAVGLRVAHGNGQGITEEGRGDETATEGEGKVALDELGVGGGGREGEGEGEGALQRATE